MSSEKSKKDRNFTIRIRNADFEFYEKNLPPEVPNLSELFRSGAKQLIESETVPGTNFDYDRLSELLSEIQSRVIGEIHQNRSLIVSIQAALQANKIISQQEFKKLAVDELLDYWLEDLQKLKRYSRIEELEASIEFDHLKLVAMDGIEELSNRKYVTVEPSGKLRWNL